MIRTAVIMVMVFLTGCRSIPDTRYYAETPLSQLTDPYIIEINDYGEFHDKNQMVNLLTALESTSENTHIVFFAHGWHHNAHPDDENLADFKRFIVNLRNNGKAQNTLGVYIGWRGKEKFVLDYFSLGSRKTKSNIVGSIGLRSVLSQVKSVLHSKRNFKVTVIGHSLGGSVVFHSVAEELRSGVFDFNNRYKYIMLNPAISSQELEAVLNGVKNRKLDLATEFPLIVMQSNRDWAVNCLLPIFTYSSSVGFSAEHMTHGSWACSESDIDCINNLQQEYNKKNKNCVKLIQNERWFIHTNNYTNKYNKYSCEESWKLPIIVIQNGPTISGSHNEILTSSSAKALLDVIGEW